MIYKIQLSGGVAELRLQAPVTREDVETVCRMVQQIFERQTVGEAIDAESRAIALEGLQAVLNERISTV